MLDYLIEKRASVVFLFAIVILFFGWGLTFLSIDPNNRVFFSESHSKYADLLRLESMFGSNTELMYVVSPKDGVMEGAEIPQAVHWLSKQAWRIDGVQSVSSLATYPHLISGDDELVVVTALDFYCPLGVACSSEQMREMSKPHLENRLVSPSNKSLAVVAKVDLSAISSSTVLEMANSARELKSEVKLAFPGVNVYLTGGVPMMEAFFIAAAKDSATLMPVVLLLLIGVLWSVLGGVRQALFLAALGVSTVIITMGGAGWVGYTINTATATVPLVVFTLVVASGMHLFMHIAKDADSSDSEMVASRVKAAVRSNIVPIVLTAVTTSLGFLSMIFVSAPPIKQLGILSAVGVVVGAFLSVTVVPCLFAYFSDLKPSKVYTRLREELNRYAKWVERTRPGALLVSLIAIVSILGMMRITVDEDFVRYFSEDAEFRSDTEQISKLLAGPYHIDVIYDAGASGEIFSEDSMNDLRSIRRFLATDDKVVSALSLIDILEEISAVFSPGEGFEKFSPDELAQYFLTYELSLDQGQSTQDLVDVDHRFARVSVLLRDVTMGEIRTLVESTEVWALSSEIGPKVVITGEGVPTAYLSGESIFEMSVGILISMILSATLVAILLKSPGIFLVLVSATVVPLLAGFGVWGWFRGDMGMAATLVVATTIGVVIDDTIHLSYRYLDGRRSLDLTAWGAAAYSIHRTGPALVVTTVALSVGFSVLLLSEFKMNSTFGLCSSLIIALALIYNLTISPRLLRGIT